MIFRKSERHKTIVGENAFDFDARLNAFLDSLDAKRIEHTTQVDPRAGFVAFVTYYKQVQIPEDLQDEYELRGEARTCHDCEKFPIITDGRIKVVRCPHTGRGCSAGTRACNAYYKHLETDVWEKKEEEEEWT